MTPVKYSNLIPVLADRLNMPVPVVTTVVQLYWQEVRSALSSLEHPRVMVRNLGTFAVKPGCAEKRLARRSALARRCNGAGIRTAHIRQQADQEILQLEKLTTMIKNERQRKDSIKQTSNYREQQKPVVPLEETQSDP